MKARLLILAATIELSVGTIRALCEQTNKMRTGPNDSRLERLTTKDRRVTISPVQPINGIRTGMVIAYGHPISPPYAIEWRGEKLYLNSVQVIPSIADEKWIASRPKQPRNESEKAMNESLRALGEQVASHLTSETTNAKEQR